MSATGKIRPKITVRKFSEDAISSYIEKLDDIEYSYPADQEVLVHIDSYGGPVYGLFMLLDRLEAMPNPIITYTSSKAMSAGAFLLAIAGSKGCRFASEDASILVHEVQTGAIGDIKDVEDSIAHSKSLNERLLNKFAKAIGKKNAAQIREMIKSKVEGHDLTITAEDAKKLGIIDEVGSINLQPYKRWNIVKIKK